MTTATMTWPAALPQRPLADGYAEGFEDNVIRSGMDKGPSKTRPRFTRLRKTRSVAFLLTDAQKVAFDSFYEAIHGGTLKYNWVDPITNAAIVVLMKGNVTGPKRLTSNRWRVSFELEILP